MILSEFELLHTPVEIHAADYGQRYFRGMKIVPVNAGTRKTSRGYKNCGAGFKPRSESRECEQDKILESRIT